MSYLVFSDLDGTLINDQNTVTKKTQQAIERLLLEGNLFVPVSARTPKSIKQVLRFLPQTPVIAFNGAMIQDDKGRILKSSPIDIDTAQDVWAFVDTFYPEIAWNIYDGDRWLSKDRQHPMIKEEECKHHIKSEEATPREVKALKTIHKFLLMGESDLIPELEEELKKKYPKLSIMRSAPFLLEIVAPGIHKGDAVKFLADYYKIPIEQTIAFGDSFNDIEMLQAVGHSFAMENAEEEVKKIVQHVTTSNNDDGIAIVLDKYLHQ